MSERLWAWIWRDARQPRLRFKRRIPLGRGWAVEILYPFGTARPLLLRYSRMPAGTCIADRGGSVRLPVVARAVSIGHEVEEA